MHKIFKAPELGLEVEIGKHARQADGAVWIKAGNDIVLATAVATKEPKEFGGFFPLTVEYRERTSAAGRIPGGYFKREGKLSDNEVLNSRLIDRPIRPLFPKFYFNEVQILTTVYSSDGKFPVSILAAIGSSLALTISRIPFMGPIGAVQVARGKSGWVFNPTHEQLETSDADMVIAGTKHGISMVEGHCNNLSEAEVIDLLFQAHQIIVKQVEWQESIAAELGVTKAEPADTDKWESLKARVDAFFKQDFAEGFFRGTKEERAQAMEALNASLLEHFAADIEAKTASKAMINFLFDMYLKDNLPDVIAAKGIRVDSRPLDKVRDIFVEVATLPCVHGSAIFQRGETQVISSLTLGTGQDAQKIDTLLDGQRERTFMLHYNFPPFATGEVKPLRGAGRREIGHGYLAETSFLNMLPSQEAFPYTIRSVVDVLESNGSSSMATVCATTMALMDAGVPLKQPVAGIAMGLLKDSKSKFHVLTDILGMEDGFGLMDFKIAGTKDGITAFQMDIKDATGLSRDLMATALEKARVARLHILEKMAAVLDKPRAEISEHAPRVTSFKIPQDKIGLVIGPAGKNIKEIIAKTGTQIDIEDDGTIKIFSKEGTAAREAEHWIKTMCGNVEVGSEFMGVVKRVVEFGVFVELVPGREGLIHISAIAKSRQQNLDRELKLNSKLLVKVTAYDPETGRIRLVAPELER